MREITQDLYEIMTAGLDSDKSGYNRPHGVYLDKYDMHLLIGKFDSYNEAAIFAEGLAEPFIIKPLKSKKKSRSISRETVNNI